MEFLGHTRPLTQGKTQSSIITHKKSTSLQNISIKQMQSRLNQLEEKYSAFIEGFLSTFSTTLQSDKNNKNNLDHPKEIKKYSNDPSPTYEKFDQSEILNDLMLISRLISSEFQPEFIKLKEKILYSINQHPSPVLKSFYQRTPDNLYSSYKKGEKLLSKTFKIKDSNRETESTSLVLNTEDLSRDSSKNTKRNHLFTNKKNLPGLRLNRIDEFRPVHYDDRKHVSTARAQKKSDFHSLIDPIDHNNRVFKVKYRETLEKTLSFLESVLEIFKNSPDNMENIQKIVKNFSDFINWFYKAEKNQRFGSTEEVRFKEELKNCKKAALMHEQRWKEKILEFKEKEKDWTKKSYHIQQFVIFFVNENTVKQHDLFEKMIQKLEVVGKRYDAFQVKIKKALTARLEELRKVVEMTTKNDDYYSPRVEEHIKQNEELELNNRNLFEQLTQKENEIIELKSKLSELESTNKSLQKSNEDSSTVLVEFENLNDQINSLKKKLKIKEFELKQKEFENSELNADKNELLSRIESLEIDKIESHECINSLAIKYNQEFENFVYNNTVQRNQIQNLEKEKEESAKAKKELEAKVENFLKEISSLKLNLSKSEDLLKQNQNLQKKIQELNTQIQSKLGLEKKVIELEAKVQENVELIKKINELERINEKFEEVSKENQELRIKIEECKKSNEIQIKSSLNLDSEKIQSLQLRISEMESTEFVLQEQVNELNEKLKTSNDRNSKLKEEVFVIKEKYHDDGILEEFEQLKEDFIELEKGNKEIIEQIKFKDLQIKDLTGKINLKKGKKSELKEKIIKQSLTLSKIEQEKEKLESVNRYLIEDIKHRHKSYLDSIEDLKLDKYEYEKSLKDYESQLESITINFKSLEDKLNLISPIPETLLECLTESRKQNEIDSYTKEIYITKINQLEEDVKNITSKLMKKNNENSILEDCLLVYSPKSKNHNQPPDDLLKIKYELIETHKLLEEALNEKTSFQSQLVSSNSQIEELKKLLDKNKESLTNLEKSLQSKSNENDKINKKLEDLLNENKKLSKTLNETKSILKNSEVTYGKNLSFLEEQVKKYKNESESSFDRSNYIISPRSFNSNLKISKENSLIIPSADKTYLDSPILSSRVPEEDSFDESSFKLN